MKHNNIAKTLGWAETPDNTEGLFLQPEEALAVDTALANVVTAAATATALETANGTIQTHEATIKTLGEKANADALTITGLQDEVKKLGKESSGPGTTLKVAKGAETSEETVAPGGKIKFDSAEHPANRFADGQKKYDSGIPAKK